MSSQKRRITIWNWLQLLCLMAESNSTEGQAKLWQGASSPNNRPCTPSPCIAKPYVSSRAWDGGAANATRLFPSVAIHASLQCFFKERPLAPLPLCALLMVSGQNLSKKVVVPVRGSSSRREPAKHSTGLGRRGQHLQAAQHAGWKCTRSSQQADTRSSHCQPAGGPTAR